MNKPIIAVDFDGVIHRYSKGWFDGSIYDTPKDNVEIALQWFLDEGYEVVIFTTRADDRIIDGKLQKSQYDEVVEYLKKYNIPYSRVHQGIGKPLYKLLIDDNAIRFTGSWIETFSEINKILKLRL